MNEKTMHDIHVTLINYDSYVIIDVMLYHLQAEGKQRTCE
jgi:hypothetical protein